MSFRSVVHIVCSPRPQVGRTLLARMLVDFCLANGRAVEAFDLNDETDLARHFPAQAVPADIADVRGQIALFDRLIADDRTTRIVDVGSAATAAFFTVMRETLFADEARRRGIAPAILFVASEDRTARAAYERLRRDFADVAVSPVYNEATAPVQRYPAGAAARIRIPALAPGLRRYIDAPFSFAGPQLATLPLTVGIELQRWKRRIFVEFRELELRLLLDNLQHALKNPA